MANVPLAARAAVYQLDPARRLWRLLTSVRFALLLIGLLALASLAGLLIPQLPSQMQGNPAASSAWLEFQRGRFGLLTTPMDRLGLFNIFRSIWFAATLALLVASICVCTAGRLPPVWRNVFRPQTRVPDEYLERDQASVTFPAPEVPSLVRALGRRRFRVATRVEGGATYLFADRFPWAQLATFVSHLALILFVTGGFVTVMTARDRQIFIAEGTTTPVFAITDRDHMQVYVEKAIARFDASGFPRDYRTELVIYRGGREAARGVTTVNNPLAYGGYRFHQSAYFPDGAVLRVREVASGRLVYDETLALQGSAPAPRVVLRNRAGDVLLNDAIVPTDFLQGVVGATISLPGVSRRLWLGAREAPAGAGWQLVVFELDTEAGVRTVLGEGEPADLGGLSLTFAGVTALPSTAVQGLPGAEQGAVAELSDGTQAEVLTVSPVQGRALALSPGQPVVLGDFEYSFGGRRAFAGITVRRDPGSTFIWVATGLLLLGLALTFYTPRRRLWGKIQDGVASFRGLGGRSAAIEKEIIEVARRAGAPAAPPRSGK